MKKMKRTKGSSRKAEDVARWIRCGTIKTWTMPSAAVAGVAEGAYIEA